MVDQTEEDIVVPVNDNEAKSQTKAKAESEFVLECSDMVDEGLTWSDIGDGEFS